jgi:hypothetical protein
MLSKVSVKIQALIRFFNHPISGSTLPLPAGREGWANGKKGKKNKAAALRKGEEGGEGHHGKCSEPVHAGVYFLVLLAYPKKHRGICVLRRGSEENRHGDGVGRQRGMGEVVLGLELGRAPKTAPSCERNNPWFVSLSCGQEKRRMR